MSTKRGMPSRGSCVQSHRHTTETMKQDIYIGMTENPFKTRYNLNNSSFRLPHKRSTTTVSEHLWTLKDAAVIHKTEWTILDKAKPCSPAAGKCDLCLTEKCYILLEKSRLLSKRSEIFGTCPPPKKTPFTKFGSQQRRKFGPTSTLARNRSVAEKI